MLAEEKAEEAALVLEIIGVLMMACVYAFAQEVCFERRVKKLFFFLFVSKQRKKQKQKTILSRFGLLSGSPELARR